MERRFQPECSALSHAAVEEVHLHSMMEFDADSGMESKDGDIESQDNEIADAATVYFGVHVCTCMCTCECVHV